MQLLPQHCGLVSPIAVQSVPHEPQLLMSPSASEQKLLQHCGMSPPHVLSHPPQLSGSLVMSVQLPSHETCGSLHIAAPSQVPPVQVIPPQSFPHEPQLFVSLSVSTQPPLQQLGDVPVLQAVLQVPQLLMSESRSVQPLASQHPGVVKSSCVQSLPQPPQLRTSLVGSEQLDEQQACMPMHAFPQVPQFFASIEVSTHAPLQQPLTVSASSIVQSLPAAEEHPPQLDSSVVVSVQTPSHCVWPIVQLLPHLPAAQTMPLAHAVPHFPQFRLSVIVSLQLPLQLV